MAKPPFVFLHLDSPVVAPESAEFYVQGWVVCQAAIKAVRSVSGESSATLGLMPREDVSKALKTYLHTAGFGGTLSRGMIQRATLRFVIETEAGTHEWTAVLRETTVAGSAMPPQALPEPQLVACPSCGAPLGANAWTCDKCRIECDPNVPGRVVDGSPVGRWKPLSEATRQALDILATHSHECLAPRYLQGEGVEIGAFKSPIPGIRPVYVDRFSEYAGERTKAEYYGDACELPFHDSSLDYVATSHVLEHVANPYAALREWYRVLKHGGVIYMVVPDRRLTFDHDRPLTSAAHMLDDYRRKVGQADGTHIDDFVFGVNWRRFSPETPRGHELEAQVFQAAGYHAAVERGEEISIHFHTFEMSSLMELVALGNRERVWPGEIAVLESRFAFPAARPDGVLLIGRIKKTPRERILGRWRRKGLYSDARRFS